ncbi:MAG: PqqD family protein [Oscillospiraceae bacterium]|nr:PqqD family protein [Oscillospiraceae bacterium]
MAKMQNENFLDRIPVVSSEIRVTTEEDGKVVLEKDNKGLMNRFAQLVFGKPKVSYIHLDDMGSFILPLMDGETDVHALGEKVHERFGENAEPLYERLCQYLSTLHSYGLVDWKK